MMRASPLKPHEGRPDGPEHGRSLAAISPTVSIEPIGQPLQGGGPVVGIDYADGLEHQDRQDLGQPGGRQFGRRGRNRLQREEA